jgi:hypothetical protein
MFLGRNTYHDELAPTNLLQMEDPESDYNMFRMEQLMQLLQKEM